MVHVPLKRMLSSSLYWASSSESRESQQALKAKAAPDRLAFSERQSPRGGRRLVCSVCGTLQGRARSDFGGSARWWLARQLVACAAVASLCAQVPLSSPCVHAVQVGPWRQAGRSLCMAQSKSVHARAQTLTDAPLVVTQKKQNKSKVPCVG